MGLSEQHPMFQFDDLGPVPQDLVHGCQACSWIRERAVLILNKGAFEHLNVMHKLHLNVAETMLRGMLSEQRRLMLLYVLRLGVRIRTPSNRGEWCEHNKTINDLFMKTLPSNDKKCAY